VRYLEYLIGGAHKSTFDRYRGGENFLIERKTWKTTLEIINPIVWRGDSFDK